jgi:hypothetical protein
MTYPMTLLVPPIGVPLEICFEVHSREKFDKLRKEFFKEGAVSAFRLQFVWIRPANSGRKQVRQLNELQKHLGAVTFLVTTAPSSFGDGSWHTPSPAGIIQ